ncbi:MAG: hypothetical protein SO023_08475, partial [Eubacterium sp.]|nr:hypothetical protein [Eubacterium sp.]
MKVEATLRVSALPSTLYHFSPLCSTFTQILPHFWDKIKHFFDTFPWKALIFRHLLSLSFPYIVVLSKNGTTSIQDMVPEFFLFFLWKFIPFLVFFSVVGRAGDLG